MKAIILSQRLIEWITFQSKYRNQCFAVGGREISILWKVKWSTLHERGTKKENLSRTRQELIPWPTKHRAGGLSTELRELMDSNVI